MLDRGGFRGFLDATGRPADANGPWHQCAPFPQWDSRREFAVRPGTAIRWRHVVGLGGMCSAGVLCA